MKKGLAISLIPLALRRMNGVKTVSSGAVNRTIPQDEFPRVCNQYQENAAAQKTSMPEVVNGLWRCEGYSTTFGKFRLPENTLNDPKLKKETWGITHVGYGAASTEHARFDAKMLHEIAETKCAPDARGFFYEGIGSIVRIYEPGLFKWMCGALGLIPKNAPAGPGQEGFYKQFFAAFTEEQTRLITHGYGRLVAFSNISIYKAIEEGMKLPERHVAPCVMGAAFAFAMMNSIEMPRLLENSEIDYPAPVRAAFQNGLVYGIVFCDWFAPGFLAAWKPQGRVEGKLVELAIDEAARNVKRGYPLPFWLENPIGASARAGA